MSVYCSQGCSQKQSINAQLTLLKCEKSLLIYTYGMRSTVPVIVVAIHFFGSRLPVIPCKLQREQMTYVLFSFQSTFMCMWQTLQFKGDPNTLLPTADKWSENTNVHKWTVNLSDFQNTPTWAWKGKWIFLSILWNLSFFFLLPWQPVAKAIICDFALQKSRPGLATPPLIWNN